MKRAKKLLAGLLVASFVCSMTLGTAMAATNVHVGFEGNDGTFTVTHYDGAPWETNGIRDTFPEGSTVAQKDYVIGKPVFWDSNRGFAGWQLCTMENWTDDAGNVSQRLEPVENVDIFTSSNAAMNYTIPDHDIYFKALWKGDDDDYYTRVYIMGQGADLEFSKGLKSQVVGDRFRESNETLKDQMDSRWGKLVADPVRNDGSGATFEGWAIFDVTRDNSGKEKFTLADNTLYTTAQIMDDLIPEESIAYVAKWSDIRLEDYFNNNQGGPQGPSGNGNIMVSFDANDGSFEHVAGGMHMNSLYHGKEFPVGTTVAASGDTMNDPVFWDANRKFEGWKLFEWGTALDNEGNEFDTLVPVQGIGLFTTAQAMNYVIPDHDIVFMAQYEGEHYDYYSRVDVQGYGAGFKLYEYVFDFNNQINKVMIETDWWGNELREDGTSLRDQACTQSPDRSYIEFYEEPKRPDATLEGWAEFKVDWTYTADDMIGEYTLVSDKLYTTDEMLDQVVRDYDVAYVAKWSDIELDAYFSNSIGVPGDPMPDDDDDDEPQYSSNSGSATEKPSMPTVTTDVKKGQVNAEAGIVTGEGAGYSKWIAESDAEGNTEWTFQYADGTMAAGSIMTNADGTTYEQPAWEQINGSWYAFGADGKAKSGWLYDTDLAGWFYIDINKGMLTGWQHVDGKWYYMQTVSDGKKGIMYANTWVDGWYVDATGAWDEQPQKND